MPPDLQPAESPTDVAEELLESAWAKDWADFDPYDGLSGLAGRILADDAVFARRVVTQAVMRSPVLVRRTLRISPRREPYSAGVFLSAAALLDRKDAQRELVGVLADTRLSDGAWGYTFPVVTRAAGYGPDEANIISTCFAALGLLDYIERDPRADEPRSLLRGGVDWLIGEAWDQKIAGFRYHVGNPHLIFNASSLATCVVARAGPLLGLQLDAVAEEAIGRLMEAQRADGSWPYGDAPRLAWVDNHHTGFVLKSLLLLPMQFRNRELTERIERGLRFYRNRLVDSSGAPKATIARRYPRDSLAAGQTTETFALAGSALSNRSWLATSERVFGWTLTHMRRNDGRFRFRMGKWLPWPGAYLRWGEAHIALGAASLAVSIQGDEATRNEPSRRTN